MIQTVNDSITWFTDLPALRRGAFRTIDAMQHERNRAVQYLGPIVTAVAMAQTLGRDIHSDIAQVRRMMADLEGPFSEEVRAIRDYASGELANQYTVNGGTN